MAAAPTRISELTQVTPQSTDQLPIARGSGSGGQTLKITVGSIIDQVKTDVATLSAGTINVVDSPTIDLTYSSATRTLSADLQQNLDLRTRNIKPPCNIEVPPGCIMPFAGATPPCGWLACNGDIVPNTVPGTTDGITTPGLNNGKSGDFARLHLVLGTTYGTTPGTLPDLRGMFIRGWDQGRGIDPSRGFGSYQSDAFQGHKHGIYDPGHFHVLTDPGHFHTISDPGHGHTGSTNSAGAHTHSINNPLVNDASVATCGIKEGDASSTADCGGVSTDSAGAHNHTVAIVNNTTGITKTGTPQGTKESTGFTATGNPQGNVEYTSILTQNPTSDAANVGSVVGNSGGSAPRTADETRPENFAFLYCIKY